MAKIVKAFIILFWVLMCFSGHAFAGQKDKSLWYISIGIGKGDLKFEGETVENVYADSIKVDVSDQVAWKLGVGVVINPKLHLGLDLTTMSQEVDTVNTFKVPGGWGNYDYEAHASEVYQSSNLLVVLSYYPWNKGLFVKAGGGLSAFTYKFEGETYNYKKVNFSETYYGMGYVIGIGYDIRGGKGLSIGLHADYSQQRYNESGAPDNIEFTAVYMSFSYY